MGISDKRRIVWDAESKIVNGMEIQPIQMAFYSEWLVHKRALTLRQSTLPAAFAIMPYLSALHAMDCAYKTCFIYDTLQVLAMATRRPTQCFTVYAMQDDVTKLSHILFNDGEVVVKITPQNFPELRNAIADQNGEELPDEGDNLELIEAENDILSANASSQLDVDTDTLVTSVAYQYRKQKKELATWTIREFEDVRRAIERDKNHMICAIAEKMPMFKWAKGNPCPSWCFDKLRTGSIALESMGDFSKRTGVGGNSMPIQAQQPTNT